MSKDSLVKKVMMLAVTGAAVSYTADFLEKHDIIDVRSIFGICHTKVQKTVQTVKEKVGDEPDPVEEEDEEDDIDVVLMDSDDEDEADEEDEETEEPAEDAVTEKVTTEDADLEDVSVVKL